MTEPDLCQCGAEILAEVTPWMRRIEDRMKSWEERVPTLAEVNQRLAVLEKRSDKLGAFSDGHVHVFVDGFDRCSWCGVER